MQAAPVAKRLLPLWIIGGSVLLAALAFFIPVVSSADNPTATHWRTLVSALIMFLYQGAAVTLLTGLKSFKRDLRIAFRLFALGFLAFSAALIQLLTWGVFDLWKSDWAASGSGLVPFVLTAVLLYAGARKFSRLVGVKGILNSSWFVFGTAIAGSIIMYIVATYYVQYDLEGTNMYIGVGTIFAVYLLSATLLVRNAYRIIGAYYKKAMRALAVGLFAWFLAAAHEIVNTFWFNNGDTYTDYGYYLIPWVIGGIFLVRASYLFSALPAQGTTSEAEAKSAGEATRDDYIDSIVAVAGLVSKPTEIDTILDGLRLVTAGHSSATEPLTADDKRTLLDTYRYLEVYLKTRDAFRTFTKEEVRSHVTPAFRALLTH